MDVAEVPNLIFNAFGERYLYLLKRFLSLSFRRLYFIQFLHEIYMKKVLHKLFLCIFLVTHTLQAVLKYIWMQHWLRKTICRTIGPAFAASPEALTHCRNIASLSLFYRYYFGKCSFELAQLAPLSYSQGRSTHYSDRLHDFSVNIPRYNKDVYINCFFPYAAKIWNSLSIEYFPLTYDLNVLRLQLTNTF